MSQGFARTDGWVGKLLLLLLLLLAALAALAWVDYRRFAAEPLKIGNEPMQFEIRRGDSLGRIVERLADHGVTERWRRPWWQVLAVHEDRARRLQAGEYALEPGISPRAALAKFAAGRVIQHRFTIVEGWTFAQMRKALAALDTIEHTLADQDERQIMVALGADGTHPEGQFLPETYLHARGTSDLELLRHAHRAMTAELDRVWRERSAAVAVDTPYELLILASIIEKETGQAGERREIAGVFSRRLRTGMRLQTDPTVIYGVGSGMTGRLRRVHLDTDTPYNTYTRAGLPPTPIAMPGRAALAAAADPSDGRSLFFVSRGDGSHYFSDSYDEHRQAVRYYQLGQGRPPAGDGRP